MQSDPLPPPSDEKLTILGVAHRTCLTRALELLKAGKGASVPAEEATITLEWGEHIPRFDFGAPAGKFECPFCQYMRSPLTDEDIIPNWMIKYVLRSVRLDDKASRILKKQLTLLTTVCGDCNNTWMSTLENDIQGILISMFENTTVLDQQHQALLAKWATMKAILLDRTQAAPIVPRGFGHDLKLSRLPHEATRVWIAAYSDRHITQADLRPILAPADRLPPSESPIGLCATFVMIRVAFQVFIPFSDGNLGPLETFNNNIVELWPNSSENLDWPLAYYFDQDSFPAFSLRINDNREDIQMNVTLKRANRIRIDPGDA